MRQLGKKAVRYGYSGQFEKIPGLSVNVFLRLILSMASSWMLVEMMVETTILTGKL